VQRMTKAGDAHLAQILANLLTERRFPPPWSVEGSIREHVRLASGCRYEFQILSAASPTAVFKDIVFDELARIECRQT
jgi:hypothetical protein